MTYHYTMCGLDYVFLRNGFIHHETDYGPGTSIERADDLDRAIAMMVLSAHARLRGQEVRFLRAMTQLSQAELARVLGVKRLTVARWESAPNTPIPGPADRSLRVVAAQRLFGPEYVPAIVDGMWEITDEEPQPLFMKFVGRDEQAEPALFPEEHTDDEGWHLSKAA
jgi:DNA-binding transcriptional regulator YiaG